MPTKEIITWQTNSDTMWQRAKELRHEMTPAEKKLSHACGLDGLKASISVVSR